MQYICICLNFNTLLLCVKEFIVKDSCGIIQVDVSALPTGYYIVNIYGCMGTSMGVGDTPIVSAKLIVDHYK